jgi:Uma2 family endonuclease
VSEPELAYGSSNPVLPNPLIAVNRNSYDRQGTYTLEDYLALPDEQRVELIDGVFYDMGAPTSPHQLIGGEVHRQLANYIRKKKGSCIPFIAPTDVQLDCDNRTIVQPDVMIVCDRSKINRSRIFGAPDFVLEVLSPSTRNKDIFVKGMKYMQAGVKEYWMVDPMKKTVTTYDMRIPEETEMRMYTFEDTVPLALYDGDLAIDFKEIADYIAFIE